MIGFLQLLHTLPNLLFPPTCLRCHTEGFWLCPNCEDNLPKALTRWCPICAREYEEKRCRKHWNFSFDEVWALLPYHEPWVTQGLQEMKYHGMVAPLVLLGTLLAKRWMQSTSGATVATSIPMHKRRLRERGQNHVEILGRAFSKPLQLSYHNLLKRSRATKLQAKLPAIDREKNVRGAFLIDKKSQVVFTTKTVILIDDVVTTGATLSEACRVLKRAGVDRVVALTLAYSDAQRS